MTDPHVEEVTSPQEVKAVAEHPVSMSTLRTTNFLMHRAHAYGRVRAVTLPQATFTAQKCSFQAASMSRRSFAKDWQPKHRNKSIRQ